MNIDRNDRWFAAYDRPKPRRSPIVIIGGVLAACWLAWAVVAHAYRQQHCVYLFGHWLDVAGPTTPGIVIGGQPIKLFCQ